MEGATVEKGKSKSRGEGKDESNGQQVQQLAFSIFDADGDGLISLTELENVLKSVGNSPKPVLNQIIRNYLFIYYYSSSKISLCVILFMCKLLIIFQPQARRSTGKT